MKITPKELRQIIKEELEAVMEDGHTDVPSAIRKLKTSMEDAMEILNALEQMPDTELPSWWMSKVTLAADYLNKSRDYLLVSEEKKPKSKKMTEPEKKEKERLVKGMKPKLADFEKRYPGRGKNVMYATATKRAMDDDGEGK
jgi:RecG-like helicase